MQEHRIAPKDELRVSLSGHEIPGSGQEEIPAASRFSSNNGLSRTLRTGSQKLGATSSHVMRLGNESACSTALEITSSCRDIRVALEFYLSSGKVLPGNPHLRLARLERFWRWSRQPASV